MFGDNRNIYRLEGKFKVSGGVSNPYARYRGFNGRDENSEIALMFSIDHGQNFNYS